VAVLLANMPTLHDVVLAFTANRGNESHGQDAD